MVTDSRQNFAPRWSVPFPYGHPSALDSMGGVAAPLLAGFAITFAALVMTSPTTFRSAGSVLVLLVLAILSLVASVQFAFHARPYAVTPSQIEEWWPNHDDPFIRQRLRREQRYHREQYGVWARRASSAYNVGILLFLSALTVALLPPGTAGISRLTAFAIAAGGTVFEFGWILNRHFGVRSSSPNTDLSAYDPAPELPGRAD